LTNLQERTKLIFIQTRKTISVTTVMGVRIPHGELIWEMSDMMSRRRYGEEALVRLEQVTEGSE